MRFHNLTERRLARCVRLEVHKRARQLNFLRLGMPYGARIRRLVEASALTATPKFEGGPARDLQGTRVARRFRLNTK